MSSGVTITCAHRGILAGERTTTTNGLVATIIYGIIFTFVQTYEYNIAPFSINDGVFGSLFFMLTGFHGFHVILFFIFCKFNFFLEKLMKESKQNVKLLLSFIFKII